MAAPFIGLSPHVGAESYPGFVANRFSPAGKQLVVLLASCCFCLCSCAKSAVAADHDSVLLLPTDVPEILNPSPLFACLFGPESSPTASFVGFRGTESLDSENYTETPPFLRIGVVLAGSKDAPTLDDAVDGSADPGSRFPTEVSGWDAVGFETSTAEPVLTPWPAIAWKQANVIVSILGEGLSRADVDRVAESLEVTSADQFLVAAISQEACSS